MSIPRVIGFAIAFTVGGLSLFQYLFPHLPGGSILPGSQVLFAGALFGLFGIALAFFGELNLPSGPAVEAESREQKIEEAPRPESPEKDLDIPDPRKDFAPPSEKPETTICNAGKEQGGEKPVGDETRPRLSREPREPRERSRHPRDPRQDRDRRPRDNRPPRPERRDGNPPAGDPREKPGEREIGPGGDRERRPRRRRPNPPRRRPGGPEGRNDEGGPRRNGGSPPPPDGGK